VSKIMACKKRKGLPRPFIGPIIEEARVVLVRMCPLIAQISRLAGDARKTCCPRSVN
jgi:hypothetical protein